MYTGRFYEKFILTVDEPRKKVQDWSQKQSISKFQAEVQYKYKLYFGRELGHGR